MLINKVLLGFNLHNRELIWDFDDDIIRSNEISNFQKKLIFKRVSKIIVTQKNLAQTLPHHLQNKIIMLPTTDKMLINRDFNNITEKRKLILNKGQLNIVWVGTSYNLPNLQIVCEDLENSAKELSKRNINVTFFVISNKPLYYEFANINLENITWKREIVKDYFERSHIGLMPLVNNQYNRGKGGFKLIQYLSSGIVTFGSDVGMNGEIITNNTGFISNDSWANKIVEIASSPDYWEKLSRSAFSRYETKFSYKRNLDKINKILEE
ncbi:glycosyltransferase [Enterococcus asini]|nr:glycosyltransferase [Enterococcus asini]